MRQSPSGGGNDAGRWYYSIAYRLLRQLRLKIDLQEWWQDKSILSNRQRLVELYSEVILQHIPERVVIFVDEIQCVQDRPFTTHVLASIRAAWNSRVPTGALNRWFATAIERHPPPLVDGRRLKLRYITQVKARPPSFVVFGTRTAKLPDDYVRYLMNGLREALGLEGVPIRLTLRSSRNPYAEEG